MKETKFKDTEIGLIPEDWEVAKFGDLGELAMCKRIFQHETSNIGDVPFYKIGTFGKIADAYITNAKYNEFKSAYRFPNKGDLLISAAGTIGRIVVYDGKPAYFQDSNIVWLAHDRKNVKNDFLFYIYQITDWNIENTTIARLYNDNFSKTIIPIPPINEQYRIASALTSIDNLISSLDKLIEKKKNIKQGAMQQLLTGKKRLKGFNEPWVEKKLEEIGFLAGQSVNPQSFPYTYFCEYSMPAFDNGQLPERKLGQEMFSNRTIIDRNTLLYNKLNVRQKRIWLIEKCDDNSICSSEFLAFKSTEINLTFLEFILSMNKITQDFIDKSKGTSNSQKRIQPKDFLEYKICFPYSGKEQSAIASVLSSMDEEITSLETKKSKYERIKQGMMQQLLTGRIRLTDAQHHAKEYSTPINDNYSFAAEP